VFWVNLPVGATAIAMFALFLDEHLEPRQHRIDWLGAILLSVGIGALLLALMQMRNLGLRAVALAAFRDHVVRLWGRTLRRRSQKHALTWKRMGKVADDWLPQPRILHPWPRSASPSNTRGRSRMREIRSSGSVRAASGDGRPYREFR